MSIVHVAHNHIVDLGLDHILSWLMRPLSKQDVSLLFIADVQNFKDCAFLFEHLFLDGILSFELCDSFRLWSLTLKPVILLTHLIKRAVD